MEERKKERKKERKRYIERERKERERDDACGIVTFVKLCESSRISPNAASL